MARWIWMGLVVGCAVIMAGCDLLLKNQDQDTPPVAPGQVPSGVSSAAAQPAPSRAQFQLDGTPIRFRYEPSSFPLKIEQGAEYQIDARGKPEDLHVFVYKLDKLIDQDDDSGEARNALLMVYLEPGDYTVRVIERAAKQVAEGYLSVKQLPARAPTGTVAPGSSVEVESAGPPNGVVTVSIPSAGRYRIDATSSLDARMVLVASGGEIVADDDDSGSGDDPRIETQLDAGEYQLRVWDYRHREMSATVSVAKL